MSYKCDDYKIQSCLYQSVNIQILNQMISKTKQKENNLINSQIYQKILEEELYQPQEQSALEYPPHSQSQQQSNKIEMIIEYGNNKTATLWVGQDDQPTTLAKRFCFKYNIDPHVINTLAGNIRTLQINSFSEQRSSFKIEKNNSQFDDKQNKNRSNLPRSRSKSHQKMSQFSKLKSSRNKTNQSNTIIQSNSSRYNVFERLYKDSKRKATKDNNNANQSKRSESRMSLNVTANNKSLNESSIQSCLQIYEKNTKLKEDILRQNQHLQEMKQQKELQKCSFKPQINPLSNLIAAKLRELDESSIVNRSSNDRQMTKIKEYLLKKQQQEMKECTFKPKIINKVAKQSSSYSSTQRYLELHNEHYERQVKKKIVGQKIMRQTELSHKPAINRISKIIVKENFFQRLEKDVQKRIQKKQSLQKTTNESRVQRRPSTGRPPANRSKGQKTIGDYLYEMSKKSRALSTKQQPQILTDPKSNQLHYRSKQLAVQYIFELLDSDQDGLISSMKINISALPQQVLRLLAPLLSEMEEVGVQLNLQQFSMALQRLYSTFSVAQKNIILKVYKSKQLDSRVVQIPSFTPNLNEYSLKIAREICSDDVDIYENSLVRMKEKENKLNRLRAQKMLDEYSECTFHPKIHH